MHRKNMDIRINSRNGLGLDSAKLEDLMKRSGLNFSQLAKIVGCSRQLLHYHVKRRSVRAAILAAKALRIDPRKILIHK